MGNGSAVSSVGKGCDTASSDTATHRSGTAVVVGLGLIGGSVGMALRAASWHVIGFDSSSAQLEQALAAGAIDTIGGTVKGTGGESFKRLDKCDIAIVATPVDSLAGIARALLDANVPVVTDVGSVKTPVVTVVPDPHFVAGHPMAGSEQEGLLGADANMFKGATWVLTPTEHTDDIALAVVRRVVTQLGANVVTVTPECHDMLVAMVSHVPHLTAVTLLRMAQRRASEHAAVFKLAAGGFRDMTRVASGHPGIWPEICAQNSAAISDVLDELVAELTSLRAIVSKNDRNELMSQLHIARATRMSLPVATIRSQHLSDVRVPVPDEKGQLAKITTLASDLDVNIYDVHIVHSIEGSQGVVTLLVDTNRSTQLQQELFKLGYRATISAVTHTFS